MVVMILMMDGVLLGFDIRVALQAVVWILGGDVGVDLIDVVVVGACRGV